MMTAHRFYELKAGALPATAEEHREFERQLAGEKRSIAAKKAAATKRAKYRTWPTRRNDHRKE